MKTPAERAEAFANLHIKGDPLILFNVWDAGSAQAVAEAGAQAIATGSAAVAVAHGFQDGEQLPFDLALANLRRIIERTALPVSLDMEGGYAQSPSQLQDNVRRVIEAGAVGINFEDQIVGGEGLYPVDEQCSRIAAARQAAEKAGIPHFYINARTDIFLKLDPAQHQESHLEQAVERAAAYAEAGASGFFAAGLGNAEWIKRLCAESPLPVNILVMPHVPATKELATLGVARISYGSRPYRQLLASLKETARKALAME